VKLAVSSLAWDPSQDDVVRVMLVRRGVTGLELVPRAYWPKAPDVPPIVLADYRARWADAGISIVALQSVLFGMPELQLFGSVHQQRALTDHLAGMVRLAAGVGAPIVVFGAPKNRLRGVLSEENATIQAAPLLRRVATVAAELGVVLCVEPVPARYGGDFLHTTAEAVNLVRAVDHPGFGLHLDAAELSINGERDAEVVEAARSARHFHISEIDLVPVGSGTVDHQRFGSLLRRAGFRGWVSIEMKRTEPDERGDHLERAIGISTGAYG
jgi:sugar phosphate isomerase/epimerase